MVEPTLFPTGPWTSLYAVVVLHTMIGVAWLSSDVVLRCLAVTMLVSWLDVARLATWLDTIALFGIATAVLCVVAWFISGVARSDVGQRVAAAVSLMFLLKLVFAYTPYVLGWLNENQMWAFSEVFAYLQILAITGGSLTGGKRFWTRSWSFGLGLPTFKGLPSLSRLMPFLFSRSVDK